VVSTQSTTRYYFEFFFFFFFFWLKNENVVLQYVLPQELDHPSSFRV
jgi:hypothetical protein